MGVGFRELGPRDGMLRGGFDDSDVRRRLNAAEKGVRPFATQGLRKIGSAVAERMRQQLRDHKKVDTGRLLNAIDFRLAGSRGSMEVLVGPRVGDPDVEPYDMVIERGRRPGSKMPPPGVLLPWMARHGIPEQMEFPLRRKIAEEGLAGQPFPYLQTGLELAGREVDVVAIQITERVAGILGG